MSSKELIFRITIVLSVLRCMEHQKFDLEHDVLVDRGHFGGPS
jgi:hypothetical protein